MKSQTVCSWFSTRIQTSCLKCNKQYTKMGKVLEHHKIMFQIVNLPSFLSSKYTHVHVWKISVWHNHSALDLTGMNVCHVYSQPEIWNEQNPFISFTTQIVLYNFCSARCIRSMNHNLEHEDHATDKNVKCKYQHQYENKIYYCKVSFIH